MDLGMTETQEMLRTTAREFFERECPTALVRQMEDDDLGYPPGLWEQMGELGWMGLAFPDAYGGADGSLTDLAVLLEEMGRALAPSPFFPGVVLTGLTVLDACSVTSVPTWTPPNGCPFRARSGEQLRKELRKKQFRTAPAHSY